MGILDRGLERATKRLVLSHGGRKSYRRDVLMWVISIYKYRNCSVNGENIKKISNKSVGYLSIGK